jgi:hypothetical protein
METKKEKRSLSRANYKIQGQVIYKDRFFKGKIHNFSLNGFLFNSDEAIEVSEGEKLVILIDLNDKSRDMTLEVNCIVRRKEKNSLGLNFDVIDYDTLMMLKEKLINVADHEETINDEFINFILSNEHSKRCS